MKEVWRDIAGYSGKYQVNSEGGVRRVYASGRTGQLHPYRKKGRQMVVKLTAGGKSKEVILMQAVAEAFLGPCPVGCVAYHKNGCRSDNYVQNIAYIDRRELGRKTGRNSRRRTVARIDSTGRTVEVYSSARQAAKENHMSHQTVTDRCNGKCKSASAPDGYAYAWEDSEISMRNAIRKIMRENGCMPEAVSGLTDRERSV